VAISRIEKETEMRKKILFVTILLVLASLLAACSPLTKEQVSQIVDEAIAEQEPPTINVNVPEQEPPTINVNVPEQEPPTINVNVPEQEPELVAPVEPLVLPNCPLEDGGVRIEFIGTLEKENGFYNLSSSMEQLAEYAGCNILVEGRIELVEEHNIWLFRGQWQLSIREGSLWVYPADWNMADFSTEKPPVAAEFVTAKRQNQVANGYDWIIFVHDGENNYVFPAGQDTPLVVLPDNAGFSEPQWISVHGIWDQKSTAFNASIGAEGATTVALLDEELFFWDGAQDNILFQSVQAWLMPSTWDQSQIENWAKAQFPEMELQPYAP